MNNEEILKSISSKKFMLFSFANTRMTSQEPLYAGVTGYFIVAIMTELIIKIFYELDNLKQAPFTHDIHKLYNWFSTETKKNIEEKYNEARKRSQEFYKNQKITDVIIHELNDVLKENPKLIKDFKYNAMWVKANYAIDWIFLKEIFDEIDKRIKIIK